MLVIGRINKRPRQITVWRKLQEGAVDRVVLLCAHHVISVLQGLQAEHIAVRVSAEPSRYQPVPVAVTTKGNAPRLSMGKQIR